MHHANGRVVSNFISQALGGVPITLYEDGEQTRSFCFVDGLVQGFVRLMASPAAITGPINLGNPVEFSMRKLAELVVAETRSGSTLTYEPLLADDLRQRQPHVPKAQAWLDWAPSVAFADGLRRTIDDFRNRGFGRA